jgi:hypothetical protein
MCYNLVGNIFHPLHSPMVSPVGLCALIGNLDRQDIGVVTDDCKDRSPFYRSCRKPLEFQWAVDVSDRFAVDEAVDPLLVFALVGFSVADGPHCGYGGQGEEDDDDGGEGDEGDYDGVHDLAPFLLEWFLIYRFGSGMA